MSASPPSSPPSGAAFVPPYAYAASYQYWCSLCPNLSVNGNCFGNISKDKKERSSAGKSETSNSTSSSSNESGPFDSKQGEAYREALKNEGHFEVKREAFERFNLSDDILGRLAEGIKSLSNAGWPPHVIGIYDEFWQVLEEVSKIHKSMRSAIPSGDFAGFYVGPQSKKARDAEGYPPHRDKTSYDPSTFFEDGLPKISTTWVALTDATPDTSCLYVVPADKDPYYKTNEPWKALFDQPARFQDIRALPAPAGTVLTFSHRLLHWGSRARPKAPHPRIAISFTFQDPSIPSAYSTFKASLPSPSLPLRLLLISTQWMNYYSQPPINKPIGDARADLMLGFFLAGYQNMKPEYMKATLGSVACQAAIMKRQVHTIQTKRVARRKQALERANAAAEKLVEAEEKETKTSQECSNGVVDADSE